MTDLKLVVKSAEPETDLIKVFVLQPHDKGSLPRFTPGSHIRVRLPAGGDRAYSLITFDTVSTTPENGSDLFRIAVRLEEESTGGSAYMHSLKPGEVITVGLPKNDFPLHEGSAPAVFLAGGIGITPITAMAASLTARSFEFRVHYTGRTRGSLAFLDRLDAMLGSRLKVYYDDEPGNAIDLAAIIGSASPESHIYVCGPRGMIEAVKSMARSNGFADEQVHFELFTNAVSAGKGDTFEVELASTGEVFTVPSGKTIIDVLEDAGHDVLYDCQRGDCGICETTVISGIPDHRDVVLSEDERSSGKVMQICVSRAKSPRLVLDL